MMSIGLPTLPGSSRGGENDDAVLNAVGRDLDNVADDGPNARAHASRGAVLCFGKNESAIRPANSPFQRQLDLMF